MMGYGVRTPAGLAAPTSGWDMEETQIAQLLALTGTVFLVAFAVLNFGVERIWFPRPHRMTPGNVRPIPPLTGPARRAHMVMGTIEGIVFIIGVLLICTGMSILGTRGYGSF
jgi:hypothetical protein